MKKEIQTINAPLITVISLQIVSGLVTLRCICLGLIADPTKSVRSLFRLPSTFGENAGVCWGKCCCCVCVCLFVCLCVSLFLWWWWMEKWVSRLWLRSEPSSKHSARFPELIYPFGVIGSLVDLESLDDKITQLNLQTFTVAKVQTSFYTNMFVLLLHFKLHSHRWWLCSSSSSVF